MSCYRAYCSSRHGCILSLRPQLLLMCLPKISGMRYIMIDSSDVASVEDRRMQDNLHAHHIDEKNLTELLERLCGDT